MNKIFYTLLFFSIVGFSQNQKEIDSLLYIANKSNNDSLTILALYKLSFQYIYSDIDKAKDYNKKTFAISQKKKYAFGFAKAFNAKGVIYDVIGKIDSAYYCYHQAILYSKKSNAILVEASAYNNIGLLNWNQGKNLEAIASYNKALLIFEKVKDKMLIANVLSNIGLIYDDIHNVKKAELYFNKALQIRKQLDDQYGLSVSYINLANNYAIQKRIKEAILYYRKSIDIKKKINDLTGIVIANNNLADLLLSLKRLDEAEKLFLDSMDILIHNDMESKSLEHVYLWLSELYILKKDIVKAKLYNQKGYDMVRKIKDDNLMRIYYRNDIQIALSEANYQRAFTSEQSKNTLDKLVEGIAVKEAIGLIETKYQTEKKEKDLIAAGHLLLKKDIESKRKTIWMMVIFVIGLAAVFIGYLFFRQQKLKNRQQHQEFELRSALNEIESQNQLQEQRLSISRDLHDNIGSQLTFIISSVDTIQHGFDIADEKLDNKLTNISSFAKDTIVELRDTIWAMNANEILFEDLEARISNFIEKAKEAKQEVDFSFVIDPELKSKKLSSVEGMNLYRTIQEAINNALKYAKASAISIHVQKKKNQVKITILDNGIGFDKDTIEDGNGLHNMKKRMEEINGEFSLTSSDSGTRIEILI